MIKPKWLEIAEQEIGQKEIVGGKDNPRIVEYHAATKLHALHDEVAWCSAFVNWCLKKAGEVGTNSAAAKDFLLWGDELALPKLGCIVVLWRNDPLAPTGHVGFYIGETESEVILLGGNQNDSVCIAKYPSARVLGYFWPKQETHGSAA